MSGVETLVRIETTSSHDDDDLMHVVCEFCWRQYCDGDLCADDELSEWAEYPNDCIVCDDLDETCARCPHCGAP